MDHIKIRLNHIKYVFTNKQNIKTQESCIMMEKLELGIY